MQADSAGAPYLHLLHGSAPAHIPVGASDQGIALWDPVDCLELLRVTVWV
jgi:hypothetical protein